MISRLSIVSAALLVSACAGATPKALPARTPSPIVDRYRPIALQIIHAAKTSSGAYRNLETLTDRIGHRLSGTPALEDAIRWAVLTMKAEGLENVHTEPVMVPHWVRGEEHAEIVAPVARRLHLLALGGSVGTPPEGIEGRLVVARSYEELEKLGEEVKGKIVLFDNPMPKYGPEGSRYGETVVFRSTGAARAAKLGAIAVLVRSVTATSLRSPHTGATRYDPAVAPIPAAAVSIEDSALLARLLKQGHEVSVHLALGAHLLPEVESANVVGEIAGSKSPGEVVLLGAHIDSWDVGQGAHDDGAGCTTLMEALALLKRLDLRPARTLRAVLFTNEENGLRGAQAYAKAHAEEAKRMVAAVEMDTGGFRPLGFSVETPLILDRVRQIAELLQPIGATQVHEGHSGADVGQLKPLGVPLLGLDVEGSRYFDYHHSEADTLDKVDPADLQLDVAAMAVLGYVLADL